MSGRRGPHRPASTGVEKLGSPLRTLALSFIVYGQAVQQGSKQAKIRYAGGKPIAYLHDDNADALRKWRAHVCGVAMRAKLEAGMGTLDGPIAVRYVITRETVKSEPDRIFPIVVPDYDKLERALNDAMTDAMLWVSDAQVCDGRTIKTYPRMHPEALDTAGVRIAIWTLAPPAFPTQETLL